MYGFFLPWFLPTRVNYLCFKTPSPIYNSFWQLYWWFDSEAPVYTTEYCWYWRWWQGRSTYEISAANLSNPGNKRKTTMSTIFKHALTKQVVLKNKYVVGLPSRGQRLARNDEQGRNSAITSIRHHSKRNKSGSDWLKQTKEPMYSNLTTTIKTDRKNPPISIWNTVDTPWLWEKSS